MQKYISFDSWYGGLCNIRTSYELAAGISFMTGRKLILPKKVYCDHVTPYGERRKERFLDWWSIFDKQAFIKEFDCIDYEEVEEYKKFECEYQYFNNICRDIRCFPLNEKFSNWGNSPSHLLERTLTFKDLDVEDKFIHFPRNLYGHWYAILDFNENQKTIFKQKIRRGLRLLEKYNRKFFDEPYNAIHVRGGDFMYAGDNWKNATSMIINNLDKIIKFKFREESKPIFIASDIEDRSIFNKIKSHKYYFISDFIKASKLDNIAYDLNTCAQANIFLGSKFSTFTDYIHILRKYRGGKNFSQIGLNYDYRDLDDKKENYAWEKIFVNNY